MTFGLEIRILKIGASMKKGTAFGEGQLGVNL